MGFILLPATRGGDAGNTLALLAGPWDCHVKIISSVTLVACGGVVDF